MQTAKPFLILFLLAFFSCTHNKEQAKIIKPKWKVGDLRFFHEKGTSMTKKGQDTIFNTTYEKVLKVTVTGKQDDGYILEVNLQSLRELGMNTSVDSLEGIAGRIDGSLKVLKKLAKYNIPYKVKVSENGEALEIIDFEDYFETYLNKFLEINDTMKISSETKATLQQILPNHGSFKEDLQKAIGNEVSEILSIYNIQNPVNGDVVEKTKTINPQTGEPVPTTATYHLKSIKNHIQKMEFRIEFGETLSSILSESPKAENDKKPDLMAMENLTNYAFNTNTSWLISSNSIIRFNFEDVDMKISSDIKVYQ